MITFKGMRNLNAQAKVLKSQKEIAKEIGIEEGRYSKLMKGKADPSLKEIDKMCYGFGCELCDLMEYEVD